MLFKLKFSVLFLADYLINESCKSMTDSSEKSKQKLIIHEV